MRKESGVDGGMTNGGVHSRLSLPNMSIGGTSLQDIAYSAQQALNEVYPEDTMPIDPALQSYDTIRINAPSHSSRDVAMSSIEHVPDSLINGVEEQPRSELGPSVEPLTPGPLSVEPNGISPYRSSPQEYDTIAVALPVTPSARRPAKATSARKASQTPRPSNRTSTTPKSAPGGRRRGSKESIKVEPRSEPKMRAMSSTAESEEDMASLALALQLQMEEHGLRRRSK